MSRARRRRCWALTRILAVAATLLLTVVWLFACRWHLSFRYYGAWSTALTHGAVILEVFTPPLVSPHRLGGSDVANCQTRFMTNGFDPTWWPSVYRSGPPVPFTSITFPLWIPIPLFALLTWTAHRRVRRIDRTGKCPRCAYDRRGLSPEIICPECGAPSP